MKEKSDRAYVRVERIYLARRPRNVTAVAAGRILFDLQFERVVLARTRR